MMADIFDKMNHQHIDWAIKTVNGNDVELDLRLARNLRDAMRDDQDSYRRLVLVHINDDEVGVDAICGQEGAMMHTSNPQAATCVKCLRQYIHEMRDARWEERERRGYPGQ